MQLQSAPIHGPPSCGLQVLGGRKAPTTYMKQLVGSVFRACPQHHSRHLRGSTAKGVREGPRGLSRLGHLGPALAPIRGRRCTLHPAPSAKVAFARVNATRQVQRIQKDPKVACASIVLAGSRRPCHKDDQHSDKMTQAPLIHGVIDMFPKKQQHRTHTEVPVQANAAGKERRYGGRPAMLRCASLGCRATARRSSCSCLVAAHLCHGLSKGTGTLTGPGVLLEGSWYVVTNYSCTYTCTYNHIRAPKGLISGL